MRLLISAILVLCSMAQAQEAPHLPDELQVPETIAGRGLLAMAVPYMLGAPQPDLSELTLAIDAKDIPRIHKAIAAGASLKPERGQQLPLFRAATTGDWNIVQTIVDAGGEEPESGKLLFAAIFSGQTGIGRRALDNGRSPFVRVPGRDDKSGDDLLTYSRFWTVAARDEKRPMYTLLMPIYAQAALDQGPSADFVKSCGITRLMALAYTGDKNAVEAELAAGADVKQQDAADWTAICWAAASPVNRAEIITLLRAHGAILDGLGLFRLTPLAIAAVEGVPESVTALLPSDEASPHFSVGQALLRAIIYEHNELAVNLMKRADVPPPTWSHAASHAVGRTPNDLFRKVLAAAPKLDAQSHFYIMSQAVYFNNEDATQALLDYGVPILTETGVYHTKFSWLRAAARSSTPVLKAVLEVARDRGDLFKPFGRTRVIDDALAGAVGTHNAEICRRLLDAGADVHSKPEYGSLLSNAASTGDLEIVKLLLERGADARAVEVLPHDGGSVSALGSGVIQGSGELIRVLVAAGADPNGPGTFRGSLLGGAVEYGNAEAFDALIAAGANPLAQQGDRGDLLTLAIAGAKPNMVTKVLESGVPIRTEPDRNSPYGQSPHLEQARSYAKGEPASADRQRVLKLIEEAIQSKK